jgi:hypothetical protein
MAEYVRFYNAGRPHHSLCNSRFRGCPTSWGYIEATAVLGRLHHDYWRAA